MNTKNLESKLKTCLLEISLAGALAFSGGCASANSGNYRPPNQSPSQNKEPGVLTILEYKIRRGRLDDGSYVYQFPRDPFFQKRCKERLAEIWPGKVSY